MIERRKDYSKKSPSKEACKIYIVCEGKETETNYFEFFQGLSSNLHLIIIPPENGKTDPLKLLEQARKLYYHFYDTPPQEDEVLNHPSMKSYVDSKIAGGFNYQKDPVRIKDAIDNSERNFRRQENGNPDLFSTEEHFLAREILGFVNSEITKLRNKMS